MYIAFKNSMTQSEEMDSDRDRGTINLKVGHGVGKCSKMKNKG